jgi:hypothetical protein
VEGSCEHGNESSGSINAGKFLSSCTIGGFSRRAQLHEVGLVRLIGTESFTLELKLVKHETDY